MKQGPRSIIHYYRVIWSILRWRFPLLLILTLLATLLDGVGLALFFPLFQLVEGGEATAHTADTQFVVRLFEEWGLSFELTVVIGLIVLVFIVKGVVRFAEAAYSGWLKSLSALNLRTRFIDGFSQVDYAYFTSKDTGALSHVSGGELSKCVGSIFQFVTAVASLCTVITYFVLAALASFHFTLLTLVFGAIPAIIMRSLNSRSKHVATELALGNTSFQGLVTELLQNAKYVLSTDSIRHVGPRLSTGISALSRKMFRLGVLTALVKGSREPLLVMSLCGLVLVQAQFGSTPIAGMIFVLLLIYRSLTHLMSYQVTWQSFLATSSSIDLVLDEIKALEVHRAPNGGVRPANQPHRFTFDEVHFKYDDKVAIEKLSMEIKPNQSVAILGPSGSGKSTFVNLLTALYRPHTGRILVDGRDLQEFDKSLLRNQIGYITQESVIFNDSIRNNITLWQGRPVDDQLLEDAAIDFVDELPDGLDTLVGDRGARLSGGQRQRICIARELYRDVSLLILDEATSSLDPKTENLIRDTLVRLRGKLTVVLVTHRLHHALDAERIVVLEGGKVVENDSTDRLLGNPNSRLNHYLSVLQKPDPPRHQD